jgi:NADH:ubiquinone reductase (non-electrogenic)
MGFRSTAAACRSLATSSRGSFTPARLSPRAALDKTGLRQSFRRAYADVAPAKKKPRRFRVLRWFWRLSYLSAIGGAGYLAYGIYELRHPDNQLEPDPNKKNLVILGKWYNGFVVACSDNLK